MQIQVHVSEIKIGITYSTGQKKMIGKWKDNIF